MMGYPLIDISSMKGSPYTVGPATKAYLARVTARPAFIAAAKRIREEEKANPRPAKGKL